MCLALLPWPMLVNFALWVDSIGTPTSLHDESSFDLYSGWERLKFESWKVKTNTQNASQRHFYCFLKEIWILKSSCSWKSPTRACPFTWTDSWQTWQLAQHLCYPEWYDCKLFLFQRSQRISQVNPVWNTCTYSNMKCQHHLDWTHKCFNFWT